MSLSLGAFLSPLPPGVSRWMCVRYTGTSLFGRQTPGDRCSSRTTVSEKAQGTRGRSQGWSLLRTGLCDTVGGVLVSFLGPS